MKSVWSVLRIALRAATWRTTPDGRAVGVPSLLVCAITLATLRAAVQFLAAGPDGVFNPYGLNATVAWVALDIAVAALFVPAGARTTALSAMLALTFLGELVTSAAKIALALIPSLAPANIVFHDHAVAPVGVFVILSLWWIGAMVAVLRSFTAQRRFIAFARVAALWLALIVVFALVPHAPVFVARNFDIRTANLWESLAARFAASRQDGGSATGLEQAQESLLQGQIAGLAPPVKGATNVYALGIAGWVDQDVFLKELDGGLAALGGVLPLRGHAVRLVNHRETLASLPLATQRNFAAAVHALGQVIDKDNDILLILMTSHGVQTGFGLRLPSDVVTQLTPQEVATALDNEGIKNRVVIVSACYAGIFLPPLRNDNTIVIAAADANNTSFGCAPERDWTYFGDAFFRQSVRPGWDLQHAFDNARTLIQGWELMDRARPSNPQAHFGSALVAKLAPLLAGASAAGQ
jgi:peptidase C13-like protein